jgi:hypothetical protein
MRYDAGMLSGRWRGAERLPGKDERLMEVKMCIDDINELDMYKNYRGTGTGEVTPDRGEFG